MKKVGRKRSPQSDGLRPEYHFDYSVAPDNPFAAQLKGRTIGVVLDPDVGRAFPNSASVNTMLRSVLAAVPRKSVRRPKKRPG